MRIWLAALWLPGLFCFGLSLWLMSQGLPPMDNFDIGMWFTSTVTILIMSGIILALLSGATNDRMPMLKPIATASGILFTILTVLVIMEMLSPGSSVWNATMGRITVALQVGSGTLYVQNARLALFSIAVATTAWIICSDSKPPFARW